MWTVEAVALFVSSDKSEEFPGSLSSFNDRLDDLPDTKVITATLAHIIPEIYSLFQSF